MRVYGRTSVHAFIGDFIVYRNLVPCDPRLPSLAEIAPRLGLPQGVIPRKSEPAYASVIAHLLKEARALDAPRVPLKRLIYLGDTRMNDGTAFINICRAGAWPGVLFICAEDNSPACVEVNEQSGETFYQTNRWAGLADFDRFCRTNHFPIDEHTAVVVDLDKTAIGARGRNDHVIDLARVEAVRLTIGNLLGEEFDPARFQTAYDRLKRAEFHPFTADNQDYLCYICLILGSGLLALESLVEDVKSGRMRSFEQFIAWVNDHVAELPASLRAIHNDIYALVQQGDPTPFKAFRYNEYRTTIGRMGQLDDSTPVEQLLRDEIVVTHEVRELAQAWCQQGALLFGLSDKPDEASLPPPELASQGYRPIHRTETHAVGA
ncbi:MAG: hypothetical protein N2508_08600 [Anaerolineae bacterium]|nr:hypothetical protein [Anaerolineae bacterium]